MDYSWCGRSHCGVVLVIGMLYHRYTSTVEWKKTQQPELASHSKTALSDADRENISIYNNYKSQLWDDEKLYFNRRRALITLLWISQD